MSMLDLVRRSRAVVGTLAVAVGAAVAVGQPKVDTSDPIAVEQMNDAMEDAFEDMPFEMNPEGMLSGQGMFGAFFGPSVTKGDFASFVRLLGLDKGQKDAAATIYSQRLENYEAKGKPMQDLIKDLMKRAFESMGKGEPFEPGEMEELTKAAAEIQKERSAMAKGVMEDLRALLTKEQETAWPQVEMAERRLKLLRFQPMQMAPGVQVDFRTILEETYTAPGVGRPDANIVAAVEQVLSAFESQLDEQAKIAGPLDDQIRSEMITTKPTPEQMERQQKLMGEGMEIAGRVQTATDAASKSIAAALAGVPAARDEFTSRYSAAAFPTVYRKLHAQNVLEAAEKLADLTDEQRKGLAPIKEELDAKLKDLRPKAVEEVLGMARFQGEYGAAKDDDARQKAMQKFQKSMEANARVSIKQADKEAVKRVRALLSDAQKEKLPKRPRVNLPFRFEPKEEEK